MLKINKALWSGTGQQSAEIPLLIVGHPRCGTNFAASVCKSVDLDVGHEERGRDGISSWMFAVDDKAPYGGRGARRRSAIRWIHMLHVVRDIRDAAPSVAVENRYATSSFAFRRKHILDAFELDIAAADSALEQAVLSITLWSRLIRNQSPDHVARIEEGAIGIAGFLSRKGLTNADRDIPYVPPQNVAKRYSNGLWGRRPQRPVFKAREWEMLDPSTAELVEEYCSLYGYTLRDHRRHSFGKKSG